MDNKDKSAAGGAVRKTAGDGAKAPDSSAPVVPAVESGEVRGGAIEPVVTEADAKAKTEADAKAKTEADAKAKKAANDKASKIKREKGAAAKELAKAEAAKRNGYYIKPGLAITSNKGIVAGAPKGSEVWEGDKVTLEHFTEEVGARLCESGAIVEVK